MACDTEILVVGAGPTGLTVALQSRLCGANVRIIDQRTEPRPRNGVQIEWGSQLNGLIQQEDRVEFRVHRRDGADTRIVARYVAGCDGPDGLARKLIGGLLHLKLFARGTKETLAIGRLLEPQ